MGAIKSGLRSSRGVTDARKVPACGEAVNDGLHTAHASPGSRPGRGRAPG